MSRLAVLVALACAVATDASTALAAAKTCPLDFPFPFPSPSHSNIICYNTAAFASAGSGTCGSWCTRDVAIGSGCGSNAQRICADLVVAIPTAPQRANLKLAHGNYRTNTKASFTVAEPLYKKAVVDFNKPLGAGHFFTKAAKKRYNTLLARDFSKLATEQALVGKTPYAASELSTSTRDVFGNLVTNVALSATGWQRLTRDVALRLCQLLPLMLLNPSAHRQSRRGRLHRCG
jgi:hypothetical protein